MIKVRFNAEIPQPIEIHTRQGQFYCEFCNTVHEVKTGLQAAPCMIYQGFNPLVVQGINVYEDGDMHDMELLVVEPTKEMSSERLAFLEAFRNRWIARNRVDAIRYFWHTWGIEREIVPARIRKDWEKAFASSDPNKWNWAYVNCWHYARDYRKWLKQQYNKNGKAWDEIPVLPFQDFIDKKENESNGLPI